MNLLALKSFQLNSKKFVKRGSKFEVADKKLEEELVKNKLVERVKGYETKVILPSVKVVEEEIKPKVNEVHFVSISPKPERVDEIIPKPKKSGKKKTI